MENIFIPIMAVAIDLILGEPPRYLHPVVGMGKLASFLQKHAPERNQWAQLLYGVGAVVISMALFSVPVYFLLLYIKGFNIIAYVLISAILLKSTFSIKELYKAALKIKKLLSGNKLGEARIGMHSLVSRSADALGKPAMVSATVESVAENTCDSFVAPVFYFLLLGVPGAIAYRVSNTFDAMVGYHGRYEYLGKFSARLDDILNFIPARLTGLMMVAAAFMCRKDASSAWKVMLYDHAKTESPNAGWTMSAAAGALNIELEKSGCYRLGKAENALELSAIDSILRLMLISSLLWISACFIIEVICHVPLT
jgi:adenosylcobinamide-phosphate synthase